MQDVYLMDRRGRLSGGSEKRLLREIAASMGPIGGLARARTRREWLQNVIIITHSILVVVIIGFGLASWRVR